MEPIVASTMVLLFVVSLPGPAPLSRTNNIIESNMSKYNNIAMWSILECSIEGN